MPSAVSPQSLSQELERVALLLLERCHHRNHLYSPQDRIIPDNLARDAVGFDALKGETCSDIQQRVTDPKALLELLRGGAASVPANCAPSMKKFEAEKARWTAKLH
jgi:hypothetical protein